MGGATVEGLINCGAYCCNDITVSDPAEVVLEKFAAKGLNVTTDNQKAVKDADVVFVVVKPWLVEPVLKDIKDVLNPDRQLLVVIAAGVPSVSIQEWLGSKCPPLFLAIPNIAIAQLASVNFLVPVTGKPSDTETVKGIFDKMGGTFITDELHLAVGMALASCGIAYAFRYIRAASEGGVQLGFKANQAKEIVMQTLKGAVALLEADNLHPEEAIDQVTTPGGYTIKGLNAMEQAGFTNAVIQGLLASVK